MGILAILQVRFAVEYYIISNLTSVPPIIKLYAVLCMRDRPSGRDNSRSRSVLILSS